MSYLAELSALSSVLDDTRKRIDAMSKEADVPEVIVRDLHDIDRQLTGALRRMATAVKALR